VHVIVILKTSKINLFHLLRKRCFEAKFPRLVMIRQTVRN